MEDSVVFVTGTSRGLGRAFVNELLARGARKVYAASRAGVAHADPRVVPITLDVTIPDQVRAAAATAADVDLLINNAGDAASASVLASDPEALRRDFEVNGLGMLSVTRAFVPVLARAARPAIVNIISILAITPMPVVGGYAASKAAAWSLTQSLRGELRARGIRVHAAFPGTIDTDMTRSYDGPKTPPDVVARGVLDGVAAGHDNITPDPMAAGVMAAFRNDPAALERQFAG